MLCCTLCKALLILVAIMLLPFLFNVYRTVMNKTTRWRCAAYKEAMLCQFMVPVLGWKTLLNPDDLQLKTKHWSFKVSDDMC